MTKPKHAWPRSWITPGAFAVFVVLTLASAAYALTRNFQHAADVNRVENIAECNSKIFADNVARVQALTHLQDEGNAAQRELDARWARDVVTHNVADIPRAYNAFRAKIIQIDQERASLGVVITASAPPPECKLKLTTSPATTPPSLSITPGKTRRRSSSPSSQELPPLPAVVTVVVTRTVTGSQVTLRIPGPETTTTVTVRPNQRTLTRTVTRTATVTPRPSPTRVRVTRTATKTVTCTPIPLLKPCP
jgi:hypothetical protein